MGSFFILEALIISVPRQVCIALVRGFAISGDTIVDDVVNLVPKSWRKSRVGRDGFGRSLELFIRALLQDAVEGIVWKLAY
jgi:hypothetical protein